MSSGDSLSSVEALFAYWLAASRDAEPVAFEALLARHPDDADALRALKSDWDRLQSIASRAGLDGRRSLDELRERFGSDVDPGVSLQGSAPDPEGGTGPSSELLARLRAHAPASSRYRILAEIGRGGMGAVLRVWDEDLRRASAMKVVLGKDEGTGDTPAVDARTLGRFLEEAQVTGQLDHPGIVPVHEFGLGADGRVYFTMRLVKGEDLRTVFEHVKTGHDGWNPTRALSVLLKVCEAMAYAHDKHVIHRDLKPANVMVGRYGEVYVMDWGLARVLGRPDRHDLRLAPPTSTRSAVHTERHVERAETPDSPLVTMDGTVMGTPAYMPPEQARGELEALGPHSDVYALGAMLYELLAGRMPYVPPGTPVSPRVILARLLEEPPKALASLAPRAPAELVAICEKAMARDPGARYRDMKALAEDLRAYLERRVVKAYESGTWAETKKWVQRNKPLAAALAGIVLVASGGAAAFARKADEATRAAEEATRLKDEAVARDRESRLRGLIQELEYFDTLDDDVYTYARQQTRPALEWWLERAHELVNGAPDDDPVGPWSPGIEDVRRQLASLQARALPATEADLTADRTSHPNLKELESKEAELLWLSRVLGFSPWPSTRPEAEIEELKSDDATEIEDRAWELVDPNARVYGRELEAVALARRAIEIRDNTYNRHTLAWALLWAGKIDEALNEELRALAQDHTDPKEGYLRRMQAVVQTIQDGSATQRHEILSGEVRALEAEVTTRRSFRFERGQDEWWHRQLQELEKGLVRLQERARLADISVRSPEYVARWSEAIAAIAASQHYGGMQLTPQLGLVPIGPDPESELWEFAHLATGTPASRQPNGRIQVQPGMGLVFTLLPGGQIPTVDPEQRDSHYDLWSNDFTWTSIEVHPFFLSKYEMTQEQWQRIDGRVSDEFEVADLPTPCTDLSWDDCVAALSNTDWLVLPTELQWEYACRAGTSTPWWTGNNATSLATAAVTRNDPLDRRYKLRPIGTLSANPFGLHDVHGNAWEWCAEVSRDGQGRPGDGLRQGAARPSSLRIFRGGSYWCGADAAQSSYRSGAPRDERDDDYGLRPARPITP